MSINLLNTSRPLEVNSQIIEWDMKRAGLSLIKEFKLLPQSEIKELEKLPKLDCDIAVGKKQIKDKVFSKNLEKAFTDMMEEFMSVNSIDKDFDTLSIKKDACFVINKKVSQNTFGKYIKFVPKNEYHAYLYLKPYEIYFDRDNEIDIKGLIGDKKRRKEILELHKLGMVNLLNCAVDLAENTNLNQQKLNQFFHSFAEMYKKKELDFDYYREFNIESKFRYQHLGGEIMADNIDEHMLEKVNIEYNYIHIILPLINLFC